LKYFKRYDEAETQFREALAILDKPIPKPLSIVNKIWSKVAGQRDIFSSRSPELNSPECFREAAFVYEQMYDIFIMRNEAQGYAALSYAIASCYRAGPDAKAIMAVAQYHMSNYFTQKGDFVKSRFFTEQALENVKNIDQSEIFAGVYFIASHFYLTHGEWEVCDRLLSKALWTCQFLEFAVLAPKVAITYSLRYWVSGKLCQAAL
jgi:hypothetical protein